MTRRRKPAEATIRQRAAASTADYYKAIREQVARDHQIEPDSDQCEHISTLILVRKNILARSLRNDMLRTDPGDLLQLDAALRQYQPPAKAPAISVNFVQGVVGRYKCSHCGEENHLKDGTYTPAARKPFQFRCECGRGTEFSADGPFTDGGDPGKPIAPAPVAEATPDGVRYREGIGSAFHAQVLPRTDEVPPLARDQARVGASYVSPGNTAATLWRNDPNPTRNGAMAHQLPVNGKG
jgi:hypothetical protein